METYENYDVLKASLSQYMDDLIDELRIKIEKGDEVTKFQKELAVQGILNKFMAYQMDQDFGSDYPIVLN